VVWVQWGWEVHAPTQAPAPPIDPDVWADNSAEPLPHVPEAGS
jgi:hypothetical protein